VTALVSATPGSHCLDCSRFGRLCENLRSRHTLTSNPTSSASSRDFRNATGIGVSSLWRPVPADRGSRVCDAARRLRFDSSGRRRDCQLHAVLPNARRDGGHCETRLMDVQRDYFAGKNPGVVDGAIVDAINALATSFGTRDYARTSLLQVQFLRGRMASLMPYLMRSAPDTKLGEADPPMSPLQAIWIMSSLIDQKIDNPDFQAIPADWDRDYYPKLLEQARAQDELRRRIATGEVKVGTKYEGRLVAGPPRSPELRFLLARRVREMSMADGLKLFNETFARLGIQ
jgi:hypothetical protein